MKLSFPYLKTGFAAPLVASVCFVTMAAQAPQTGTAVATSQPGPFPAPTNLKVLPNSLTGQQVQDIMEQWKVGLGMSCAACHADDKERVDQDGRPLLNFARDSKPEKAIARIMYTMTEEINGKYIARIDGSGVPVTCGTCHHGHIGPDPFTTPPDVQLHAPIGTPPSGESPAPR